VKKDYSAYDCQKVLNEPKMKIALTNIIVNAVEAMTGEDGKLKILTRSTGDKLIIQIEDNGCGISKENLKNIFKPYFTSKPGGLGLGLAATLDILRSNHVTVKVESEVGKGTCFILSLDKNY
ncbi:MAG: sensor histidine kinase, partial [Flavisolibacter sp.]